MVAQAGTARHRGRALSHARKLTIHPVFRAGLQARGQGRQPVRFGPDAAVLPYTVLILAAMGLLGCEGSEKRPDTTKVPEVVGQDAAAAKDKLEAADLTARFRVPPLDETSCRVVSQEQRPGSKVKPRSDVDLRCVVEVPRLVGRRAEPAQATLTELGLDSQLTNAAGAVDLSRCKVVRQSERGGTPPGATVALRLNC